MQTTPISLLERLRKPDRQAAWKRFVDLYTPLLFYWARRFHLQESDAADLVQEILLTLVRELPEFDYRPGGRFRGWLWTVVHNAWSSRQRRLAAGPSLESTAPIDGLSAEPGPDFGEREYQTYLCNRAMELMRSDFREPTWKACWELVVAERPAADVAAELGLSINAVYLAKSRVLRRLRQELEGLIE